MRYPGASDFCTPASRSALQTCLHLQTPLTALPLNTKLLHRALSCQMRQKSDSVVLQTHLVTCIAGAVVPRFKRYAGRRSPWPANRSRSFPHHCSAYIHKWPRPRHAFILRSIARPFLPSPPSHFLDNHAVDFQASLASCTIHLSTGRLHTMYRCITDHAQTDSGGIRKPIIYYHCPKAAANDETSYHRHAKAASF